MDLSTLPIVSPSTIERVLDNKSLLVVIKEGLANFSREHNGVEQPVRTVLPVAEGTGMFGCMPVYSKADDVLATKLLSFFPSNKDTPTHSAVVLIFCTKTGIPKALLDGDVITAKRTAAVSTVATKYLVNGTPKVLAILGSGVQAASHYAALCELFTFEQVKIWNHREAGAQKLAESFGSGATACASVQEAVKDADIIVTVTSSTVPILFAEWVKPGAHINAIGACRPTWSEVDPNLMRSSVVYVESREAAMKESGDIILAKADIFAEIGEVINGTKEGRSQETTIFKSLGMAIEDAVAGKLVLEKLGML